MPDRLIAGAMTGTSLDAIDVVRTVVGGRGLDLTVRIGTHRSAPLGAVRPALRSLADGDPMTAETIAATAWAFGEQHADVLADLLGGDTPDLVCVHGQTVHHRPPHSWQLLNPTPIAHRLGCPVVFDLRQADLAAGGQGAPITPLADWIMFRSATRSRAIVNLGGFCNVTHLPRGADPAATRGADLCPCNHLLDGVARRALGVAFDEDGAAAGRGHADAGLVDGLADRMRVAATSGRSLGSGDEGRELLAPLDDRSPDDAAATMVDALARTIAERFVREPVDEIIVAGGGARNTTLVRRIGALSGAPVTLSDQLGVPCEAREAAAMAILGALCADGVAITIPAVTGVRSPAPVAGVWIMPPARSGAGAAGEPAARSTATDR